MSESNFGHGFHIWENYYTAANHTSNPQGFIFGIVRYVFTGEKPEDLDSWKEIDRVLWDTLFPSFNCSRRQMLRGQGAPIGNTNGPNGRRGNNQSTNQSTNQTNRNRKRKRIENIETEIDNEIDKGQRAFEQYESGNSTFFPPTLTAIEDFSRSVALARKRKSFDAGSFAQWFFNKYDAAGWKTQKGQRLWDWGEAVKTAIRYFL